VEEKAWAAREGERLEEGTVEGGKRSQEGAVEAVLPLQRFASWRRRRSGPEAIQLLSLVYIYRGAQAT
jgi:hypothetical protein